MNRVTLHLKAIHGLRSALVMLLAAFATAAHGAAYTPALLNLLDTPLSVSTPVGPNVLLTFDDSGSMQSAYVPDDINSLRTTPRFCSSTINGVYYNPTVTYQPPVKSDGTSYPNASFGAAWYDGFHTANGSMNLSNYSPTYTYSSGSTSQSTTTCGQTVGTGYTAFYFVYTSSLTGCSPETKTTDSNDACYTKVNVASTSTEAQNFANWYSYYRTRNLMAKSAVGRAFGNFPAAVRVAAQHLNNTTAGSGTTAKFTTTIGTVGQFCDNTSGTVAGCPTGSTARTDFYTRLYNSPDANSTPTIPAVQRAVSYFGSQSPTNGAYRDTPSTSTSPERSCRQNFQIIMTDGYWNASTGNPIGNPDGNTSLTLPTINNPQTTTPAETATLTYTGQHPFSDAWSNTLADNAFVGWATDLRTDLTNNVPRHWDKNDPAHNPWNPLNDPAGWQHLVTFTIGLGVPGSLTDDESTNGPTYTSLVNGSLAWRDPDTGCPSCDGTTVPSTDPDYGTTTPHGTYGNRRVDDLWHAALDSRGQYVSAADPQTLVNAFAAFVQTVVSSMGSASSVTVNAASLTGNNYVYQSTFNSGDWSGHLLAYAINPTNATINTTPSWDAADVLNGQNFDTQRTIITYKPSGNVGIPFRWPATPAAPGPTEMDTIQSGLLNVNPTTLLADSQGQARLNYIRGDASNEGTGNNYPPRTRTCGLVSCPAGTNTGVLGDAVDSSPVYVGAPYFSYDLNDPTYLTFKTNSTVVNRTPMVYVGANDGMLHGFNATNGKEVFAYVPSAVYGSSTKNPPGAQLGELTATPYAHHFYVDGDPVYGDAFINGAWHSILVGGLRKGGQGIYALDITDPSKFATESLASQQVLWEFTDKNDADLGFTFSRPVIAKMGNGRWAVIVGNGYNNTVSDDNPSTTGHAVLYILFIEDGMAANGGFSVNGYIKIDTGVGVAATPNGLSSPFAADFNGDDKVDAIYAGDMQGNMWRFDVTDPNPSNWTLSSNRKVIFAAKDSLGNLQPITTRPMVGPMPNGNAGAMVYFGTGRYLDGNTDASSVTSPNVQTFYGVWDSSPVASPTRSNLQVQTMKAYTVSGGTYRVVSNNPITWKTSASASGSVGWYLDLTVPSEPAGERNVTDSVLRDGRIIFTTMTPSSDPCVPAGTGALMELDAANGGQLDISPFDTNGDGVFDQNDLICVASCGTASAVYAPAGGLELTGTASSPVVMNGGNPAASPTCSGALCNEQKLLGTNSNPPSILQEAENPSQCTFCRSSWRQVR